jgi:hypothetical protein
MLDNVGKINLKSRFPYIRNSDFWCSSIQLHVPFVVHISTSTKLITLAQ